jgi:hypothetical protein
MGWFAAIVCAIGFSHAEAHGVVAAGGHGPSTAAGGFGHRPPGNTQNQANVRPQGPTHVTATPASVPPPAAAPAPTKTPDYNPLIIRREA